VILIVYWLLIFMNLYGIDLLTISSNLAHGAQSLCLRQSPPGPHHHLYSALICGQSLPNSILKMQLIQFGLIHCLVVSGAHLLFLERFIQRLLPRPLIGPALFLYSIFSGLQAPVLRAYFQWLFSQQSHSKPLPRNPYQISLISGLLCLALFPQWILSYSFLLSWSASLCLHICSSKSYVTKHIALYFCLFIFISPLGSAQPISILSNILLTPIVGAILFPLSFISFFFHPLLKISDLAWSLFLALLNQLPHAPISKIISPSIFQLWLVLWIFLLSMVFISFRPSK